jgi:hypothetical protein
MTRLDTSREFRALSEPQKAAVLAAIDLAKKEPDRHTVDASDRSGEAYAYRLGDAIAWGFNKAPRYFNVARGTVPK